MDRGDWGEAHPVEVYDPLLGQLAEGHVHGKVDLATKRGVEEAFRRLGHFAAVDQPPQPLLQEAKVHQHGLRKERNNSPRPLESERQYFLDSDDSQRGEPKAPRHHWNHLPPRQGNPVLPWLNPKKGLAPPLHAKSHC